MLILLSLALTAAIVYGGGRFIKSHARASYAVAGILAFLAFALVWSGVSGAFPVWIRTYILSLFTKGALAMALFFYVMFANAVPNGSSFMKKVMPLRGELSIIASILVFGHAAAMGRAQLRHALGGGSTALELAALGLSFVLMALRLPLFVTSFHEIRRRMAPAKWKKLQRMAYGFYALAFIHILTYNIIPARSGSVSARVNVIVYGALFVTYAVMRVGKYLHKKYPAASRTSPALAVTGGAIFAALVVSCFPLSAPVAEAPVVALAEESPVESPVEATAWTDGEYTGRGAGYNGTVKVALTIEAGQIVDARIKSCVDDQEYIDMAADRILASVMETQSASVDAVSGATTTSEGLIEAIGDALSQASGAET